MYCRMATVVKVVNFLCLYAMSWLSYGQDTQSHTTVYPYSQTRSITLNCGEDIQTGVMNPYTHPTFIGKDIFEIVLKYADKYEDLDYPISPDDIWLTLLAPRAQLKIVLKEGVLVANGRTAFVEPNDYRRLISVVTRRLGMKDGQCHPAEPISKEKRARLIEMYNEVTYDASLSQQAEIQKARGEMAKIDKRKLMDTIAYHNDPSEFEDEVEKLDAMIAWTEQSNSADEPTTQHQPLPTSEEKVSDLESEIAQDNNQEPQPIINTNIKSEPQSVTQQQAVSSEKPDTYLYPIILLALLSLLLLFCISKWRKKQ